LIVVRQKHFAHAARAQTGQDAVPADPLGKRLHRAAFYREPIAV